jgi:hypothetical protein
MTHDWEQIDRSFRYNWYDERIARARELGFAYISESMVMVYRMTGSCRLTGKLLTGITPEGVRQFLLKIGEPLVGRGGYHG